MTPDMFIGPASATLAGFAKFARSASGATLAWVFACLNSLPLKCLSKHRRPIAVAVSIALHVLFILALLPHNPSGFSTGGRGGTYQEEGDGLNLDLTAVALPNALALQVREPDAESLAELDTPERLDDLATLVETESLSDVAPNSLSISQPEPPQDAASSPAHASAARQGGEGQGGTSSGKFDDLCAAIAPCWRRVADTETLPVNLTVSFAGNGMLAKPPEIVRAAEDSSNAKALRSESLAITALAECGAYQMAAGRENVSIHFPKP